MKYSKDFKNSKNVNVSLEGHKHDDLYFTETEITNFLNGKADTIHGTHVIYGTSSTKLTLDTTALVGTSSMVARSDHTHEISSADILEKLNGNPVNSDLNADLLDTYHASIILTPSSIPVRDLNGDIFVNTINLNKTIETAEIGSVFIENNTNDGYLRKVSLTDFKSQLHIKEYEIPAGPDNNKGLATGSGIVYMATDTGTIWKDIAINTWKKMGGQDVPVASGTVSGTVKIGANLYMDSNGVLNAEVGASGGAESRYIIKSERFTIENGQTTFTLTEGTYKPHTNTLFWYTNGIKQDSTVLNEISDVTFQVPAGLDDGTEILVEYFQITHIILGLGNVDNTSDLDKPISTATQTALDLKSDLTHLHDDRYYTKEFLQTELGNVDNTSDLDKPISTATQTALDSKEPLIGYSTIKNGGNVPEILSGNDNDKGNATGSNKLYLSTDTGLIWKDTALNTWTKMGGRDIPNSSSTTLGLVKIGSNINVDSNGVISIDPYDLPKSTPTVLGGVKVGDNINVDTNGIISVPKSSSTTLGLVKVGSNLTIDENGVLNANSPYLLPKSTPTVLGGVKVGDRLTIDENGVLNVPELPIGSKLTNGLLKVGDNINVDSNGVISIDPLPKSSSTTLGLVKIGDNINVDSNGVISIDPLPKSSSTTLGGVKVGSNLTIDGNGILSANDPYILPKSSSTTLGGVKIGDRLTIDENGVLNVPELVKSSSTTLGGVKVGSNLTIDENGVLNVPIAGYSNLGLIKIGNNLNIDENGILSAVAVSDGNYQSFIIKSERFDITNGQTIFNLLEGSYKPNTNSISWYTNGIKQDSKALIELSSTSFQIPAGLDDDTEIMIEYFQLNNLILGLNNLDNTSDLDKPISTATQTALDNKSNIGHLHTKTEVGLNNLDNTSDLDKPISTATQTALDNKSNIGHLHDDRYYTETETDNKISTAISNLVNTAPSTLDTLNELSIALGNDPNFSTTITNNLSNKIDKSDYNKIIGYAVTTGTANNYIISLNPAPTSYTDGMTIKIKISATNINGSSYINVNGLGNKLLLCSRGLTIVQNSLKINNIYEFTYNSTTDSFNIVGDSRENVSSTISGYMSYDDKNKLDGIEAGSEVNNISDENSVSLTNGNNTSLHFHSSDRNRSNHTGTQTSSTISDFSTSVNNNILSEYILSNNLNELSNTDSVVTAFGRLQKQIKNINGNISNLDNTSDLNKPISIATQTALDSKQPLIGYSPIKNGNNVPEILSGLDSEKGNATGSNRVYISNDTGLIWKDIAIDTWKKIGGQDIANASSTNLGLVKIGSNINVDSNGVISNSIANYSNLGLIKVGNNLNIDENGVLNADLGNTETQNGFIIKTERFIIENGETTFNLTLGMYRPHTNTISWFINGIKQESSFLNEISSTSFGIPSGLDNGNEIMVEYYQAVNSLPNVNSHAFQHQPEGSDPIPLATITTNGLLSYMDKIEINKISTIINDIDVNESNLTNHINDQIPHITNEERNIWNNKVSNIAHTGDVTGSSNLTISEKVVTFAKMADVESGTIFYRKTNGTGSPEVQTLNTLRNDLNIKNYSIQESEPTIKFIGDKWFNSTTNVEKIWNGTIWIGLNTYS